MPFKKPYILCEDCGGTGFWRTIIKREFPDISNSKYSIRSFQGLSTIDESTEFIRKTMKNTLSKQSPIIIFIIDADVYLKKYPEKSYDDIAEDIESILKTLATEENFIGDIHCLLLKNCLESLICCDLEVIWRTRIPPVKERDPPQSNSFRIQL